MKAIRFTKREASVVLDVLTHLSAYDADQMRDMFDWTKAEQAAWYTSLRKVDDALVQESRRV